MTDTEITNPNESIQSLVNEALRDLDNHQVQLSAIVRKCIRIARLRHDYINLIWLLFESVDQTDKNQRDQIVLDILPHLPKDTYQYFRKKYAEMYISEREGAIMDENLEQEDRIIAINVGQIEIYANDFSKRADDINTPGGMHPLDTYYIDTANAKVKAILRNNARTYLTILERIRSRIHEFLSQTEAQLTFGKIHADIFEENRNYVDLRLGQLCPEALQQFVSAYKRMKENDPESWSQAVTSCRRLFKSMADVLYPPTTSPVICYDGKERILTDELYISRLWQFTYEKLKNSTSSELLKAEIEDVGHRLDSLNDLVNKGVHAQVSKFEVNQAVIQTYIVIGDLLRIADNISASQIPPDEIIN